MLYHASLGFYFCRPYFLIIQSRIHVFFYWDSLHAKLNSHYEELQEKEAQKRLQPTGNLFRKNLHLKDIC